MNISRRQLLQGAGMAGLGLLTGCSPEQGQQQARIPRIGYLSSASPGAPSDETFLQGLRELGYQEGQSIQIEWRYAEGHAERLPQLLTEQINVPVDLILASGPSATLAVKQSATTLPVVMCFGGDPLELGLIESLARPGGNITGVVALTTELGAKRLELLTEALPGVSRVAVLWDASIGLAHRERLQAAAQTLRLQLQPLEVDAPDELDSAIEGASGAHAQALFVAWDPRGMFNPYRRRIADLTAGRALPWTGGSRDYAAAGALLTYGADFPSMYRRAASHVERILKGTKPADLPVEQPTIFELVVNLKTAQALGLTIPQQVLLQATEIIQ